jgi:hypothetical protein
MVKYVYHESAFLARDRKGMKSIFFHGVININQFDDLTAQKKNELV